MLWAQEFSGASSWTQDGAWGTSSGTGNSGNFPSLTPSKTGEMYLGFISESANSSHPALSGTTAGFTYTTLTGPGTFRNNALIAWYTPAPVSPLSPNWSGGDVTFQWAALSLVLPLAPGQLVMPL